MRVISPYIDVRYLSILQAMFKESVRRWVFRKGDAELLALLFRKEKDIYIDTLDPPDCLRPS
jgi:hypothetical protein